jgi:hypothetical protein
MKVTILVTADCPRCSEAVARYPGAQVLDLESLPVRERAAWCSEAVAAGWDMTYPCVILSDGTLAPDRED